MTVDRLFKSNYNSVSKTVLNGLIYVRGSATMNVRAVRYSDAIFTGNRFTGEERR